MRWFFLVLFNVCFFCCTVCQGAPVQLASPIVLGQSCALSGPAQNLGLQTRAGLLAAFSLLNDNGGIRGCEVILLSRDQGMSRTKPLETPRH